MKSTPVQHEEVDFADMCARLQHQLSTVEGQMSAKMNEQAEKYESTIRNLKEQVQCMQYMILQCYGRMFSICLFNYFYFIFAIMQMQANGGNARAHQPTELNSKESPSLSVILSYLEGHSSWDETKGLSWYKAASWVDANGMPSEGTEASVLLAYCFDALKKMYKTTSALIEDSKLREKEQEENLVKLLGEVRSKSVIVLTYYSMSKK